MDFDFDPFDDSPAPTTSAPRFKPKAKAKARPPPQMKSSVSVPSAPSIAQKEIPVTQAFASTSTGTTHPIEAVNVAESVSDNPGAQSLVMAESIRTEVPLENDSVLSLEVLLEDENGNSELVNSTPKSASIGEKMGSLDVLPKEAVNREDNQDRHSSLPNPCGENVNICLELEGLDNVLFQSTTPIEEAAAREFKSEVEKKEHLSVLESDLSPSNAKFCEEETGVAVPYPDVDAAFMLCQAASADRYPNPLMTHNTAICRETTVLDKDGFFQVDNGRVETEEIEAFPCLDTVDFSEPAVASGQRSSKFMPKPKLRSETERSATKAVESLSCLQYDQLIPPEAELVDGSTISAFPPDDAPDFSSMRFDDPISTDPTPEHPVDEEPTNTEETFISDAFPENNVHSESVSRMAGNSSGKSRKRKSPSISDLSGKAQQISTNGEDKAGASLSLSRKIVAAHNLVDECDDNTQGSGGFFAENPGSAGNEVGDEYRAEISSQKKKVNRKSKKSVNENGKTKRKKAVENTVENTDQSPKEPPKRFPRSTRRNKRCVDKVLLQTPEDELDRQNIRLKDLILLAEYKEKTNKEAAALKIPSTNQSPENYDPGDTLYNEDEEFASEQDRVSFDGEENVVQEDSAYFNYQTFMDKVPTVRWSKQDTELFYQAVRQFGADISMIQQLFPNRTRRQVKLKYKKEERQHPSRLDDALRSRSKDHSHYRQIIEQLKKPALTSRPDANEDHESTCMTDDETQAAVVCPQNEVEDKTKQVEEEREPAKVGGVAVGVPQSPTKSHDSDDFDWSQYESVF